jgi:hypothetical protein
LANVLGASGETLAAVFFTGLRGAFFAGVAAAFAFERTGVFGFATLRWARESFALLCGFAFALPLALRFGFTEVLVPTRVVFLTVIRRSAC